MSKVIKISDKVAKELDARRHIGQSYNGVLVELLNSLTCHLCGEPSGGEHPGCPSKRKG